MEWKPALQGTYSPNMNACWSVAVEIWTFEKLAYKTLSQCDGNADADTDAEADDRGDYNSSPCTSYRRAKLLPELYDLSPFQDIHILDAGCGPGHYTKALIELGVGKHTLLDASPAM